MANNGGLKTVFRRTEIHYKRRSRATINESPTVY
jgi:hypothetical protein